MRNIAPLLAFALLVPAAALAEVAPPVPAPALPAVTAPALPAPAVPDAAALQKRVDDLEATLKRSVTRERLAAKEYARLKDASAQVAAQRAVVSDFGKQVEWMNRHLAGYSRYLKAGSMAATVTKYLPVPYAGQASGLASFLSQSGTALNAASTAVGNYLKSSNEFICRVDAVNPADPRAGSALAAWYAEERLMPDMEEMRVKIKGATDVVASALSFLQAMDRYMGVGDEYWSKTRSLFGKKEAEEKEKEEGLLKENIRALKERGAQLDAKVKLLEDGDRRLGESVAALKLYEELMKESDAAQ